MTFCCYKFLYRGLLLCCVLSACPGTLDPNIKLGDEQSNNGGQGDNDQSGAPTDDDPGVDSGTTPVVPDPPGDEDPNTTTALPKLGDPCKCATNTTPFTDCECDSGLRCFFNPSLAAEPRCYQQCSVGEDTCAYHPNTCPDHHLCFSAAIDNDDDSTTSVDYSVCLDVRRGPEKTQDTIEWNNHDCVSTNDHRIFFSDETAQICPSGFICATNAEDVAGCTPFCLENSDEYKCPSTQICSNTLPCGFCLRL